MENLRRMSSEARRLSQRGFIVLLAAISPYRAIRAEIRAHHKLFIEVFVSAPLEVCEERDPKGLYQRARAGLIDDFTGISSPYEEPLQPDLECKTHLESIDQCCRKVVRAVEQRLSFYGLTQS